MICITGAEQTREYDAAVVLRTLITATLPGLATDVKHDVVIIAGAKCHGQAVRDLDLVLIARFNPEITFHPFLAFADWRDPTILRKPDQVLVRSLCCVIEVKEHSPENVRFVGTSVNVRYAGISDWHSASEQNEKQLYSLKNYLEHQGIRAPWLTPLLWLRNVPNTALPPRPHSILPAQNTWQLMLNVTCQLHPPHVESGNWVIDDLGSDVRNVQRIIDLLTKVIEPTRLDRQRVERLSKSNADLATLQNDIGRKLIILRGRGGTGKTTRLLQLAKQLSDERASRILLLTYNKALKADLERLLEICGIKPDAPISAINPQTAHGFFFSVLRGLGILHVEYKSFLENYSSLKAEALTYLNSGAVTTDDINRLTSMHQAIFRWDFVMVDEGQDWPQDERQLLLRLFQPGHLIIADGVDQLVRGTLNADWREGLQPSQYRVEPLRQCLRMKASIARFVTTFAQALGLTYAEWQPHEQMPGGRVIVLAKPYLNDRTLHDRLITENTTDGNKPIDMLFCAPSVFNLNPDSGRQSIVASTFTQWGYEVWDGISQDTRDSFPTDAQQLRVISYDSCRGLEGWIVVHLSLDKFYRHKLDLAHQEGNQTPSTFAMDRDSSARQRAAQWTMIPLTRAIDTLVVQVDDLNSEVGRALALARQAHPNSVEWIQ